MSDYSNILIAKITEKYGTVKRTRNCFLYTEKQIRLTDLYQQGGRAILGWGKGSAITVFKNVLERKITGTFDTDFSPKINSEKSQLSKAITELLGNEEERRIFVFNSISKNPIEFVKTKFNFDAKIYQPWNNEVDWKNEEAVIIEPPFAWSDEIFVLALKNPEIELLETEQIFRIPAPLCAAFTRSIYDLIKELPNRQEKNWFIYDKIITKYWTRKGPYLYPKMSEEKYQDFMLHCLDCELVISPIYEKPSIIPFGADFGNFTKLKNAPFEF